MPTLLSLRGKVVVCLVGGEVRTKWLYVNTASLRLIPVSHILFRKRVNKQGSFDRVVDQRQCRGAHRCAVGCCLPSSLSALVSGAAL